MKYSFNAQWFSVKLTAWMDGRTLRQVGEDTGVNFSTLHRIRAGKVEPTVSHFLTLCAAMNADPLDFAFNETLEPEEV